MKPLVEHLGNRAGLGSSRALQIFSWSLFLGLSGCTVTQQETRSIRYIPAAQQPRAVQGVASVVSGDSVVPSSAAESLSDEMRRALVKKRSRLFRVLYYEIQLREVEVLRLKGLMTKAATHDERFRLQGLIEKVQAEMRDRKVKRELLGLELSQDSRDF